VLPWLLLLLLLVIWMLWAIACAAEAAVADARRGIPKGQRRGVSILPAFPLFPLVFWVIALLIDSVADPWGTLLIGGGHLILGVVWSVSIYRCRRRLAEMDGAA
jgi:hypothetical protein